VQSSIGFFVDRAPTELVSETEQLSLGVFDHRLLVDSLHPDPSLGVLRAVVLHLLRLM
jgi:hypothetical protein